MRVLHVAPTAFGDDGLYGGGERYPFELARALSRLDGVRCEVVTFGPRAAELDDDGLRVRVLRAPVHWRGHPAHPLAPALRSALGGADIVHTHHLRSAPSRLAALAGRAGGRHVVVTDHGLGGGDWFGVLPRLFDHLIAVSRYSAAVVGFPDARTTVIHGGADTSRFRPRDDERRDGVLFVGRLTPHKGVDRLIGALPAGASLSIIGTGGHDRRPPERDYPDHLKALARGRAVRFLGAVGDRELARRYRRAAVVAVPSVDMTCYGRPVAVSELLGLSTLEAMASGTPVVASRLGGLAEIVVDGETGYLVEPGDVGALHDRLAELLADPARAREMGAAGRNRAVDQFSWDACARRCLDAYRLVLSRPARRSRRRRRATPTP